MNKDILKDSLIKKKKKKIQFSNTSNRNVRLCNNVSTSEIESYTKILNQDIVQSIYNGQLFLKIIFFENRV